MESKVILPRYHYATAVAPISSPDTAGPELRSADRGLVVATSKIKPNLVFLDLCVPREQPPDMIRKLYPDRIFGDAPVAIIASDTHQDGSQALSAMRFLGYYYDASVQQGAFKTLGAQRFTIESRGFYEKLLLQQFKEILLASHQLNHDLTSEAALGGVLQALLLFDRKQRHEYRFPMIEDDLDPAQEALVELVEFCPSCLQYDIRLNYSCPTCRSVNLKSSVNMQTMNLLFECQHCGRRMNQPSLRGRCRKCNKQFPSEKLIAPTLYRYEIDDGQLNIQLNHAMKAIEAPVATEEQAPTVVTSAQTSTTVVAQANYLPLAFREAKISYIPPIQFQERLTNEINLARAKKEEITLMSVKLPNLPLVYAIDDTKVMVSVYKAIIYYISDFLRFRDAMSFNLDQQKIIVILPATPLKLAKIIARKIINQLYQFRQYFQVDINLASFPQDGKSADEILTMLELGLEKVQFEKSL
ncbi:MAG: hypothetical protein ONB11_10300 [candidate division KSB1 bacterium]|nr:hypothetical protein [candidate division KSB1 bacterium]